jgi:DNA-binding transcriptional regulator YiaG
MATIGEGRGERRPSGASFKLLSLVEKNGLASVA